MIEGLEAWRQKIGIEKMILSGHSLGAYIATKYASKYSERIISLPLISPAGIWPITEEFIIQFRTIINQAGFVKKNVFKKAEVYWTPGKSPLELLRKFGRTSSLFFKAYVGMYKKLKEDEKLDLKEYLYQILMKPGSGELAMGYLLDKVFII